MAEQPTSQQVFVFYIRSHTHIRQQINIADNTDQNYSGVSLLSSAGKHTNTPAHNVCKGQIYFNKTSELQPQFHFDEFPPAGVSQAVGGRVLRREREVG